MSQLDNSLNVVDIPSGTRLQDETGDYKDFWDKAGHKYSVLIRRTADYIVYISEDTGRIDWATSNSYDLECKSNSLYVYEKKCRVLADAALLEARPCSDMPEYVQRDFRILIGEALVSCFEHAYETAERLINSADQYISARSQEQSRYWYVMACLWSIAPFVFVAIVGWCWREYFIQILGASVFWLIFAVCAGALGGLFSVLLRTGEINFDSASGRKVHNLEGIARVLTGAMAGGLIALAIRSELLLPSLIGGSKSEFVLLFLAMVAGSGERLASSMIEKFDSSYKDKN